jgi:ubiquitin-activating enzyme E1
MNAIFVANKHQIPSYTDNPDTYQYIEKYLHETMDLTSTQIFNNLANKIQICPQEFEKDNDSNYHILYIQSTSNNRASNYQIPLADFYQTKGIAGKIIPALATTTSIVSSLITIEMLKYLSNPVRPIDDYTSSTINLADNMLVQFEPMPTVVKTVNNIRFTEWGQLDSANEIKFISNRSDTLHEFIKKWSDKFKCQIHMVLEGSTILYMENVSVNNLPKLLDNIISSSTDSLIIMTNDDSVELPEIQII